MKKILLIVALIQFYFYNSAVFGQKYKRPNYTPSFNGCGAEGGTQFPNFTFYEACKQHDICYGTCFSNKSQCDQNFLGDMINSCPTFFLVNCTELALIYYAAVANFGQDAFDNGQKKGCIECSEIISFGQPTVPYCIGQDPSFELSPAISPYIKNYSLRWSDGHVGNSTTATPTNSNVSATLTSTDLPGGPIITCIADASVNFIPKNCDEPDDEFEIPIVRSVDPNDIVGPLGYGPHKMISKFQSHPYIVRFENDPDFATAPAQIVKINHPLDSTVNIFSLRLGDFGFAGLNFQIPPNKTFYSTRLNVFDSLGVVVDVTAGIDISKKEAFWIFESKDPATGLPPTDASKGFLPINDSITNKGEGFVSYTIKPGNQTQTGDSIHAVASIVFDDNAPIITPTIWNTIDAAAPISNVSPNPATTDSTIALRWHGQDDTNGSGLRDYSLYASENNNPYALYQSGLTDTATNYPRNPSSTYRFFTVSYDNVGNQESIDDATARAITIGSAPDFSHSINEAITFDTSNYVVGDTIRICNYIRNYGGQSAAAFLKFYAISTLGNQLIDSIPFTLAGSDSTRVCVNWAVAADSGLIVTQVSSSVPSESNLLNNYDTISFKVIDNTIFPVITPPGPITLCSEDSATLSLLNDNYKSVLWSTSDTTRSITVKASGSYFVTVTNFNGKKDTSLPVVVNILPVTTPVITASGPTTFCANDSVTLTSTPATAYLWSNGDTTRSIVVKTGGNYIVTNTNSNGCISPISDTVKVVVKPLSYYDTSVVICNKFTWHDSTYVMSGDYTFIGTNAVGCDSVETLHLTILSVTSTYTKTDAACFGSATGSITITPTSGVGPYSYRIGTVGSYGTANTFTNLKAGSYRVSILDATGCAGISDQVIITQQPAITATFTKTDAGCSGSATGSITVTPTSGIAPYTYRLGTSGVFGSSNTFNNLRAGTYRVSILDANNCPGTVTNIVIAEQPAITSTFTKTDAGCLGSATGSLTVTPASGLAPYTFKLGTTGSFGAANSFSNLTAGTYKVYIQDANGCTGTTDPIIIGSLPPIAVNFTITNVSCKGMADGSFTATPTNGTPPFTYKLGTTGNFGTSNIFTGLRAATYVLFVKDANGCSNIVHVTVNQPAILGDSIATTNVLCFGGKTGIIKANATGGTPPYLYRLGSVGGFSTANIFIGLRIGSYRVYVQDANGCNFNSGAIISQPTDVSLTFTKTDLTCINKNDGTITLTGVGGTPPYKFRLGTVGTFATANHFTNLRPGSYRAYIQDSNNCPGNSVSIPILQSTVTCVSVIAKTTKPPVYDSSMQVLLVPNPTTSQFTLTVQAVDEPLSIRVLDINGRTMYAAKGLPGQSFKFGKSFMKGIYLVEVRQGNQIKTLKAIKE